MDINEIKPHMPHRYCFTRWTVAQGIAAYFGEQNPHIYIDEAGNILRRARRAGHVKFIQGRIRSVYYDFVNA